MKLNILIVSSVLGFFISTQAFASQQNPVNFFDSAPANEPFLDLNQAQKPCALPCQFGKSCSMIYNENPNSSPKVFVNPDDEVNDPILKTQICALAQQVVWVNGQGERIYPIPHPSAKRQGEFALPFKDCPSYQERKEFLKNLPEGYQHAGDASYLVDQFNATKNSGFFSGMCSVVSSSSMSTASSAPKFKKRKKAIPVVSSVDTELDQRK